MTPSRRQFLQGIAATAAFSALDRWPVRAQTAAGPAGRLWTNKHRNISEPIWRYHDVFNHSAGELPFASEVWRGGLARLQSILAEAQSEGRRLRAVGAAWSLSHCAVCPDVMVNILPLNDHHVGLSADEVSTSEVDPSCLVFAQCGTGVRELSETLEDKGLSLPTSGASNGQTIAGAISTGTHGSARRVGSMQDFILGLHLLAENGRSYWIERASKPIVSTAFCERLGATLLRDDNLFRAAVVSFGSFGIIHAVLFEAAPGYLLEVHRRRYDWSQVADVVSTLDMSALDLPYPSEEPFHFDVSVNPYCSGPGGQGAVVTAMYKREFQQVAPRKTSDVVMVPGVDLLALSGRFAKCCPLTIARGVNAMFDSMMKATERPPLGTHGQVFPSTPMVGRSLSTELGVDLANARAAVDILIDTARKYPFPGLFGLRYVQRSDAFLAFTKFDTTCTIEMTGAGGDRTREFYRRAWAALDSARIPFTQHWGKVNNTIDENIRQRWGSAVDDWLGARRSLLSPAGRALFSNDLLVKCDLHK